MPRKTTPLLALIESAPGAEPPPPKGSVKPPAKPWKRCWRCGGDEDVPDMDFCRMSHKYALKHPEVVARNLAMFAAREQEEKHKDA